jgi:hypothetical protein
VAACYVKFLVVCVQCTVWSETAVCVQCTVWSETAVCVRCTVWSETEFHSAQCGALCGVRLSFTLHSAHLRTVHDDVFQPIVLIIINLAKIINMLPEDGC